MDEQKVTALVAALGAADPEQRRRAAEELSQIGEEARGAAVALVQACGDEVEEIRELAVAALEEMGPPRTVDLPALMELLGNTSADVGYWAATLIGRLEQEATPAVPALILALQNSEESAVRQRAAWALGNMGPTAKGAAPALKEAVAAEDPRLARLAGEALEKIERS